MLSHPVPVLPAPVRIRPRTALVASADGNFRQRLNEILTGLRWQVREAGSGAEAWTQAEAAVPEAVIVDSWLPDLDHGEFLKDFRSFFPDVDLVSSSGNSSLESPRGPHRQELLYALRRSQDTDTAAWNTAPALLDRGIAPDIGNVDRKPIPISSSPLTAVRKPAAQIIVQSARENGASLPGAVPQAGISGGNGKEPNANERLPELVGNGPCMLGGQSAHQAGCVPLDSGAHRGAHRLRQGTCRRGIAPALDPQSQAFRGHQLRGDS